MYLNKNGVPFVTAKMLAEINKGLIGGNRQALVTLLPLPMGKDTGHNETKISP
jgi:hypothetical protein